MSLYVDGINGLTFPDGSAQPTSGYTGFRNRIINGAMVIDQRNAGAAITLNGIQQYPVDRFNTRAGAGNWGSGTFTSQQNKGSVTPPLGQSYYMGLTTGTTDSLSTTTNNYEIVQWIEGYNCYDLAFGTANARSITLSFWVYSSLTGTFGGSLQNGAGTRFYLFSYTISAANTWTYITVNVPGDVTGSWPVSNAAFMSVRWSLGTGSSYLGTVTGAWNGTANAGVNGQVQLVSNSSANWYITGVQLERAGVASPFEFRPYGTELALCQRYFCKTFDISVAPAQNTNNNNGAIWGSVRAFGGASGSSWEPQANWYFPVSMRIAPNVTVYAAYTGITAGQWGNSSSVSASNTRVLSTGNSGAIFDNAGNTVAFGSNSPNLHATANAEM